MQQSPRTIQIDPKLALGAGIGIGVSAIYLLVHLWPVILVMGAGWLMVKGIGSDDKEEEENT